MKKRVKLTLETVLGPNSLLKDLSKDNVIEKIQEALKEYSKEYKEWEEDKFNVNHLFKGGHTLLHYAVTLGNMGLVNALAEQGADVNLKDAEGNTPLHLAIEHECIDAAYTFVKKGADVNAVDRFGNTPLDYAKERGLRGLAKAISDAGGRSFKQASYKGKVAGGATALLGTAIAVALFTTGTIAIPIVIAVVAVTAAALLVGGTTYMLLKPSTKVNEVEKTPVLPAREYSELPD